MVSEAWHTIGYPVIEWEDSSMLNSTKLFQAHLESNVAFHKAQT